MVVALRILYYSITHVLTLGGAEIVNYNFPGCSPSTDVIVKKGLGLGYPSTDLIVKFGLGFRMYAAEYHKLKSLAPHTFFCTQAAFEFLAVPSMPVTASPWNV